MQFREDLLQYLWLFRSFDHKNLATTKGEALVIIDPGLHNKDSGPDFSNARIQIGATEWVGNIEIHIAASDWLLHRHQSDNAYNNVILHVVFQNDQEIYRPDGTLIPVLLLQNRIPARLLSKYNALLSSPASFPCAMQFNKVDPFIVGSQLSRTLFERMLRRSAALEAALGMLKGDWEELFYRSLARNFGFKVNGEPFSLLAASLPSKILYRYRNKPFKIEALLFGQAGFLEIPHKESYPLVLKKEYKYLRRKYSLDPLTLSVWKFMRMRPFNFPTIRLAQFCALIASSERLFSRILEITTIPLIRKIFQELEINDFWKTHFHFSNRSEIKDIHIGRASIDNIIINTVCVFLFAYGKYTDRAELMERSIRFLEELPSENNRITRMYKDAGL
ncbi:MAG: DUF2851 family protein, partial [Pedobacter sp.]